MASQPPEGCLSGQVFSLFPFMTSENARQPEVSHSTLTWVNQAGVTLIVLIPAARDGIPHNFLLSRADTLNLVIFAALATHDIPLSSGAGFINDCVLCNRNQQVRTKVLAGRGKTHKYLTAKKQPYPTNVLPCLNDREDTMHSSRPISPKWGG